MLVLQCFCCIVRWHPMVMQSFVIQYILVMQIIGCCKSLVVANRWSLQIIVILNTLVIQSFSYVIRSVSRASISSRWRHSCFNLSTLAPLVRHSRRLKSSQSRDQAFCYADNFCRERYSKAKDNNNNTSKTAIFNICVALRLYVGYVVCTFVFVYSSVSLFGHSVCLVECSDVSV